jgi:hypothetical protein
VSFGRHVLTLRVIQSLGVTNVSNVVLRIFGVARVIRVVCGWLAYFGLRLLVLLSTVQIIIVVEVIIIIIIIIIIVIVIVIVIQ